MKRKYSIDCLFIYFFSPQDNWMGFRKYPIIIKTLLHELAHMVHSEHDAKFHALNRLLNKVF